MAAKMRRQDFETSFTPLPDSEGTTTRSLQNDSHVLNEVESLKTPFNFHPWTLLFFYCLIVVVSGAGYYNWPPFSALLFGSGAYEWRCETTTSPPPSTTTTILDVNKSSSVRTNVGRSSVGRKDELSIQHQTEPEFVFIKPNIVMTRLLIHLLTDAAESFFIDQRSNDMMANVSTTQIMAVPHSDQKKIGQTNNSFLHHSLATKVPLLVRLDFSPKCNDQKIQLVKLYTFGFVISQLNGLLSGIYFDWFGPRITAMTGQLCCGLGWFLLSMCSREFQAYAPALLLIGSSVSLTGLPGNWISVLFPKNKNGFVLSVMSASFDASFCVPLLMSYVWCHLFPRMALAEILGYYVWGIICPMFMLSWLLFPNQVYHLSTTTPEKMNEAEIILPDVWPRTETLDDMLTDVLLHPQNAAHTQPHQSSIPRTINPQYQMDTGGGCMPSADSRLHHYQSIKLSNDTSREVFFTQEDLMRHKRRTISSSCTAIGCFTTARFRCDQDNQQCLEIVSLCRFDNILSVDRESFRTWPHHKRTFQKVEATFNFCPSSHINNNATEMICPSSSPHLARIAHKLESTCKRQSLAATTSRIEDALPTQDFEADASSSSSGLSNNLGTENPTSSVVVTEQQHPCDAFLYQSTTDHPWTRKQRSQSFNVSTHNSTSSSILHAMPECDLNPYSNLDDESDCNTYSEFGHHSASYDVTSHAELTMQQSRREFLRNEGFATQVMSIEFLLFLLHFLLSSLRSTFINISARDIMGDHFSKLIGMFSPLACIPCILFGHFVDYLGIVKTALLLNLMGLLMVLLVLSPPYSFCIYGATFFYIFHSSFVYGQMVVFVSEIFGLKYFGVFMGLATLIDGAMAIVNSILYYTALKVLNNNFFIINFGFLILSFCLFLPLGILAKKIGYKN